MHITSKNFACIMKTVLNYFLIITLLTSCAISRKVNYSNTSINVPNSNIENIGIASWDQRPQVTDGSRKPDFVGYMRSGAGIAYPMSTESGKPLMDVLTANISKAFNNKGVTTSVVTTNYRNSQKYTLNNLVRTGRERLFLVKCNELHTDGYSTRALLYNIDLYVYNHTGNTLVTKNFSGKKYIPKGKFKVEMPKTFKSLFEEIFNDPEISETLNKSRNNVSSSILPDQSKVVNKEKMSIDKEIQINIDEYDIIYTTEGQEINAIVIEITNDSIKYKKAEQPDGPLRNLSKSEVFMIIYKDGSREVFKN